MNSSYPQPCSSASTESEEERERQERTSSEPRQLKDKQLIDWLIISASGRSITAHAHDSTLTSSLEHFIGLRWDDGWTRGKWNWILLLRDREREGNRQTDGWRGLRKDTWRMTLVDQLSPNQKHLSNHQMDPSQTGHRQFKGHPNNHLIRLYCNTTHQHTVPRSKLRQYIGSNVSLSTW